MMNHPLMPTLYDDPVVTMAYDRWDRFHIWLHKQPLFLWQIALSFKMFGISEYTLRLPSVILATALVPITYRTGKLIFNRRVGYFAAVLIISSIYLMELVSGRQEVDHNDISFLAYVSLSVWAWVEYLHSRKRYWLILIGLFSGMAILCKWLVGLLIYLGWGIYRLQERRFSIKQNADLLLSLLITVLVALPWQLLTYAWYPQEAAAAQAYNTLHLSEAVEAHSGSFWYHFEQFPTIYGWISTLAILPGIILAIRRFKQKKALISLMVMVAVTYLFYSFAATKMPSFTVVVAMPMFLFIATCFDGILNLINSRSMKATLTIILLVGLTAFRFDIGFLESKHGNEHSKMMVENKAVFEGLSLPENTVIFNVKGRHYVECMFYTGQTAYHFIPSKAQFEEVINKGRAVAIFHLNSNEPLPDYLQNGSVILIDEKVKGYQ